MSFILAVNPSSHVAPEPPECISTPEGFGTFINREVGGTCVVADWGRKEQLNVPFHLESAKLMGPLLSFVREIPKRQNSWNKVPLVVNRNSFDKTFNAACPRLSLL